MVGCNRRLELTVLGLPTRAGASTTRRDGDSDLSLTSAIFVEWTGSLPGHLGLNERDRHTKRWTQHMCGGFEMGPERLERQTTQTELEQHWVRAIQTGNCYWIQSSVGGFGSLPVAISAKPRSMMDLKAFLPKINMVNFVLLLNSFHVPLYLFFKITK